MKKLLMTTLLASVATVALAQNQSIYGTTGALNNSNASNLTQCKEMDESKLNMLSQYNMKRQVCLYENYAKLMERWTTQPQEIYAQRKSIIITRNAQPLPPEIKEKMGQTSQQCQALSNQMRNKLKEMYGVEELSCDKTMN